MQVSFDQKRERRAEARRFRSQEDRSYLHFLAVASQLMCAFSQADLLVGALSAAKAGAAKATVRASVKIEASVFMGGSPCIDATSW